MHLVVASIKLSDLPEDCDPARQAFVVFLGRNQDNPVVPFPVTPLRTRSGDASRRCQIENQQAPWLKNLVDSAKQAREPPFCIARVEKVAETLSHCSNSRARRDLRGQERRPAELRFGRAFASEGDHGVRNVDTQDIVAGGAELPCPYAAAAAKVNHQTAHLSSLSY